MPRLAFHPSGDCDVSRGLPPALRPLDSMLTLMCCLAGAAYCSDALAIPLSRCAWSYRRSGYYRGRGNTPTYCKQIRFGIHIFVCLRVALLLLNCLPFINSARLHCVLSPPGLQRPWELLACWWAWHLR